MELLENRSFAGKKLSEKLLRSDWENTIVLGLPRGGVPVAWEIARALNLPLDILLVKKIGALDEPEFALGAISEDNKPVWNSHSVSLFNYSEIELKRLAESAYQRLQRQTKKWRKPKLALNVKGKNVILVDDGLATGMTMLAAIEYLNRNGVNKVTVAVPVASKSSVEDLKGKVRSIVTLQIPEPFFAVGQWYDDFTQVSDEVVTNILERSQSEDENINSVKIHTEDITLSGEIAVPVNAKGVVIFAHGSGSSHKSPRNQFVAKALNKLGIATFLFDLLTEEEEYNRANVFDIQLLASRLKIATDWICNYSSIKDLKLGYFGASTGAAAALLAASKDNRVVSIVSRGGRPDLAEDALERVTCPTLLIVGGDDYGVIELNQSAKARLPHAELVVIEGAGHLFEEAGTLNEVVEYTGDWFLQTFSKTKKSTPMEPHELVVQEIAGLAHPIRSKQSYKPLLEKLSQSRVVMLGEATHGTEEFYEVRKDISKQLIEDYGFNFIAVEGDWPACYQLNKYIQGWDGKDNAHAVMKNFKRWPTWMWANQQVEDLIEWMKGREVGFYGLDVYSLYESLDLVKIYAKQLDPKLEKRVLEAYSCLSSFNRNEIDYAKSLVKWPEGCEKEIVQSLREILRLRLEETQLHEHELFEIQQNAKTIRNAEKYYRSMMFGGPDSWNIRDGHMIDTLSALLQYHGKDSKGIVWAHNTHVGDYHATDMLSEGYVNLGGLARERFGMEHVSLTGFGTYEGEVLAGRAWEAKPEVMKLAAAPTGTYEDYFHKVSELIHAANFYIMIDGQKALKLRKGHRAVGVVYQPIFESHRRNYVPTELSNRYDNFIFIDKTTALKALPAKPQKGVLPETWPIGV